MAKRYNNCWLEVQKRVEQARVEESRAEKSKAEKRIVVQSRVWCNRGA